MLRFNDANNPGVIWYKRLYTLLHRTCKQYTVSIKTNLWLHTRMLTGPKYTLDPSFKDAEIPHGVREEHVTC